MKAVWVIEVRDQRNAPWRFYSAESKREVARLIQLHARDTHAYTRIAKYVREAE